ncbi:hypothetical protein B0H67DRAFT_2282 [Lasiosphaeris hirsuta]|uniref:DUF1772 domain-containing protein n=1 Tax=Lasiosphaeris hirsuta TaxID=260670 RepID=A0AA40EBR3_9PEZI|nr:hypothetical protein B0H67DRAFT_2282 [Lasiosphaeris hirsuta]
MMSLSAFVVPVLLDTNPDANHMVRQWARLYHYGHIYLPALCIATVGLYGLTAARRRSDKRPQWTRYALAGLSTVAMVPFTWLIMTPTNDTLFRLEAAALAGSAPAAELADVRDLVVHWAWLHATRSLSPLVGAYLGFTNLLGEVRLQ